jgi:hypothetical protein
MAPGFFFLLPGWADDVFGDLVPNFCKLLVVLGKPVCSLFWWHIFWCGLRIQGYHLELFMCGWAILTLAQILAHKLTLAKFGKG